MLHSLVGFFNFVSFVAVCRLLQHLSYILTIITSIKSTILHHVFQGKGKKSSTEDADDSRKSARLGLAGGEESLHLSGLPPIIPDKYGYKRKSLDEGELMARVQDINSVKGQRQKQADVEIALICLMKEYSFSLEVPKRCLSSKPSPILPYYHEQIFHCSHTDYYS